MSGFAFVSCCIIEAETSILTAQNKNRMIEANPPKALTNVLQKIPLAAATDAFLVSSATCPDASNPIKIPAVARYDKHQFQPLEAPVPLYVVIKASSAVRNPRVLAVPIGSQIRLSRKSKNTIPEEKWKTYRIFLAAQVY